MRGLDKNLITILVLIDFTKAFDTLSHRILLSILNHMGLDDTSQHFFNSFLSDRSQIVKIENILSTKRDVLAGVPQGAILSPLLYTLYTSEFPKILKDCNMHLYADDTQIYYSFDITNRDTAIETINDDIDRLVKASQKFSLLVNPEKTSVLVFTPKNMTEVVNRLPNIKVGNKSIPFSSEAKNLGLLIQSDLKFRLHVNKCIRLAYANLKMIYSIRCYLGRKQKKMLCESLVLSRFNFADSVYGPCISAEDRRRIQVVQNSCLRLTYGIRRGQHISHKLIDIGWLNMSNRRKLHQACIFHKVLIHKEPRYLYRKINFRSDVHNLNIRFKGRLTPPSHRTEGFKRSFSYQITKAINSLPHCIKSKPVSSFKNYLKRSLFSEQTLQQN